MNFDRVDIIFALGAADRVSSLNIGLSLVVPVAVTSDSCKAFPRSHHHRLCLFYECCGLKHIGPILPKQTGPNLPLKLQGNQTHWFTARLCCQSHSCTHSCPPTTLSLLHTPQHGAYISKYDREKKRLRYRLCEKTHTHPRTHTPSVIGFVFV